MLRCGNVLVLAYKIIIMSKKEHTANEGLDGSRTGNKGESQVSHQQGAKSVGNRDTGKHKKDESDGSDRNTTKKGANSV